MKQIFYSFFLFFITISFSLYSADYNEYAKTIRQEVWNWDKPEFKNYIIPEEYNNESAIIIARHQEISVSNKNKFDLSSIMLFVNKLYYSEIERITVKINDVKALEEYSKLSFKTETKKSTFYSVNKAKTIVGVRIVKPDGNIKEVDVDNESVSMTEGKKEDKSYKKLAIPHLQIGDILDYFYCTEMELNDLNIPPLTFSFYGVSYPILSYSVRCEVGNKLTTEYRSINGAPKMTKKVFDNNTILEVQQKNLPKIEFTQWMSPLRDFAMIRMLILNNESQYIYKLASAREGGTYENVSKEAILNDAKVRIAHIQSGAKILWSSLINNVKKDIKNYQLKYPTASPEDLALYLYDDLFFNWRNYYSRSNFSTETFFILFGELLKMYKVEYKLGFVSSKYGARMDEIVSWEDLDYIVVANDGKQCFFPPYGYGTSDDRSVNFQGEKAFVIRVEKFAAKDPEGIIGVSSEYVVPEILAEQNDNTFISEISFSIDNPVQLLIQQQAELMGDIKLDIQPLMFLLEDWDTTMRERLLIEKSLMQELEENKKNRKYIEEYRSLFEKNRKEQKENVKLIIQRFYEKDIKDLKDYSIESLGVTAKNPTLKYSTTFIMDDFVKKAGDNLILEVGKLIGTQWIPSENDKKRKFNAYLPSPLSITNKIRIQIPEGYKVENISNLNFQIENTYGLFESYAHIENNTHLSIQTRKAYNKTFIAVNEWGQILEVADKTNDFYGQSIVLKKE